MTQVSSLELSRKLFELSGWKPDGVCAWWNHDRLDDEWFVSYEPGVAGGIYEEVAPAYTSDFLLEKLLATLPKRSEDEGDGLWLVSSPKAANGATAKGWLAGYSNENPVDQVEVEAPTPSDALCKLACSLFESGVLERRRV